MRKAYRIVAATTVALLLLAGGFWYFRAQPVLTVSGEFTQAANLYEGNTVRILGVEVGTVRDIRPQGATVRVTMTMPRDTEIPAQAEAWVITPAVISERFVEIGPAYTGGETMSDGATIPVERTHAPLKWDQLLDSVDQLLTAFGPDGANSDGALARALDSGARALEGNGKPFREAVRNIAQASELVAGQSEDATALLSKLDTLAQTLADNRKTVRSLSTSVTEAARLFDQQREAIGTTITNLSGTLERLATLIREHGEPLTEDLDQLSGLTSRIMRHQRSLTELIDTAPLAFENFNRAVTEDNRLRIRLNISTNLRQIPLAHKACERLPIPLCSGAGVINPIPFPPPVIERLGLDSVLGGGG